MQATILYDSLTCYIYILLAMATSLSLFNSVSMETLYDVIINIYFFLLVVLFLFIIPLTKKVTKSK